MANYPRDLAQSLWPKINVKSSTRRIRVSGGSGGIGLLNSAKESIADVAVIAVLLAWSKRKKDAHNVLAA